MPVLEAASISRKSKFLPTLIPSQFEQVLHGTGVGFSKD
jgi:hypothetical protein